MVHLANLGKLRPHSDPSQAPAAAPVPVVKLEIEDQLEEEHGPLNKKPKSSPPASLQQWGSDAGMVSVPQSAHYSLLDEPSPLGLRLRKSPSLLDLIQMRLSQGNSAAASCATSSGCFEAGKKKDLRSTAVSGATDKLKASNFPVTLLRIGSYECVSRYEGDLVAKCYYAKHKLVWEVLDGGLKSKIEIQWSDITALKATYPENGPGTLDIVLARQPLFFRETNPQPRKHTLWQATSDFTKGQASLHRRHFLQCPPGLLGKHFEKLIQCDPRLNSLSQQPEITLESSYFEQRCSVFDNQDELKSGFQNPVSPCEAPMSTKNVTRVPFGSTPDSVRQETLSPSSVMDAQVIEENRTTNGTKDLSVPRRWDQIKVPGLRSSMSMSDLVNHIGHCISGQTTPGNPLLPTDSVDKSVLEELTQYLLSDSQVTSATDEQFLMSRVNSLCCLIQHKDPGAAQVLQTNFNDKNTTTATADDDDDDDYDDDEEDEDEDADDVQKVKGKPLIEDGEQNETSGCKPGISRKDSYGELLLNLPRIASFPFLFNIAEH